MPTEPQPRLLRALRIALVVAGVLLVAVLVWWALGGGGGGNGGEEEAEAPAPGAARIVSPAELRAAAASSEAPVHWAGERPGTELELSEEGGRSYVRYLTGGAAAGDPRPDFLTVGTYRLPGAFAALKANAKRTGVKLRKAPRGFLAWVDPSNPTSVYLARPGAAYQVEVYDPSPKRALRLALSPSLRPVAGS
jgi:hypothetical protein